MRAFLLIIFTLFCGRIVAQENYYRHIDSLRILAENAGDDRADTLYMEVGRGYAYNKPAEALKYLRLSIEIAERNQNHKILCMAYSFMGIAYSQMGSYAKSVESFNNQLNVAKEQNMTDEVAWANSNIGQVLLELKNYEIANIYLNEANDIAERINDDYMKQFIFSNMGWLKLCMAEYDESLDFYNKALEIRKKPPVDSINLAANYRDIGNLYFVQKNFKKAKEFYNLSTIYCDTINYSLLAPVMVNLAYMYHWDGNKDSALICAQTAIKIAQHVGEISILRDAYGIYGDIYYKMGKYADAEQFYSKQIEYHDSVNHSDVSKKIYELEYHKNIEAQQIAREEAEMHTKTIMHFFIAIGLLAIALIFFVIWLRKKRKTIENINKELALSNKQTNESIEYAKKIQKAVMPNFYQMASFMKDKFLLFKPKHAVSGNFYWMYSNNDLEMFAVCDSGESGVPGGCICTLGAAVLHEIALTDSNPAEILEKFRQKLVAVMKSVPHHNNDHAKRSDISILVINKQKQSLSFSGTKFPLLIIRNGQMIKLQNNNEDDVFQSKEFATAVAELQDGDMIYMMTHGLAKQTSENGEELSRERLFENILQNSSLPMSDQSEKLQQLLNSWRGNKPQQRDILVAGATFYKASANLL